ncbi:MAG: flagellar biosynthesis protein FlhB [Phycisphaerae bacterium]|jgi:flagellar biosynthetic protein FlhB
MAADDAGDRTEDPTPKRLTEARREGRIPRSTDLTAAVALLGALLLLKLLGGGVFNSMLDLIHAIGDPPDVTADSLGPWLQRVAIAVAGMLLPFLLLMMVITAVGAALQSGVPISTKRLAPKLDKLNPMNGLKRLWSLDSVTRMGMGVLKMILIALVAYFTIVGDIDVVLSAGTLHPFGAFDMSCTLMFDLALRMAATLLLVALIDYAYQRWNWWRKLKMTKQEVKDEMKNMEGDPQVRARRRRAQMQVAMQRLNVEVPRADVVVTNPTEFAVALQYDEATMHAPRVNAKGQDLLALRIRQLAQQHGVPIVQRPPLARALYAAVEVGQEVPPTFYRAVAELLAYVYQLSGRQPAARSA